MKANDFDLSKEISFEPERGLTTWGNSRLVIFEARAMGLLRQSLLELLGWHKAQRFFLRFGYRNPTFGYLFPIFLLAVAFTVAAFDHGATAFPLAGAHVEVACSACHATERAPDGAAFVRFRPLPTDCASCHGS